MKKHFFLIFMFLLMTRICAFAYPNMIVEHYTAERGLPNNIVNCTLKGQDGFVWFGTWYGLCSFDGTKFRSYDNHDGFYSADIPPRKIQRIVEDRNGYLWIKTIDRKLYLFDKKHESFHAVYDDVKEYSENIQIIKIQTTDDGDVLLLKFDIVHMQDGMNPAFVANIEKDGVELMDKLHEKYNYLKEAVKRLREALDDYKKYPLDSVRDGAIQRFEFCTELAWKTMREYLLDQGYTNINSPKEVIKQAFAFGMIEDSKVWLELLNDRNLTSHVYDEATARAIFDRIESQYLPLFDKALAYMKE